MFDGYGYPIPLDFSCGKAHKFSFDGGTEFAIIGEFSKDFEDNFINNRPQRFHQIVGKRKSIVTVVMPDAKHGRKPSKDDVSGDESAQNRITVVEAAVDKEDSPFWSFFIIFELTQADKVRPKQGRKVHLRRSCLNVVGIATANKGNKLFEVGIVAELAGEDLGLAPNFSNHDLLPNALFGGQFCLELFVEEARNLVMTFEGEEN